MFLSRGNLTSAGKNKKEGLTVTRSWLVRECRLRVGGSSEPDLSKVPFLSSGDWSGEEGSLTLRTVCPFVHSSKLG